MKRLVPVVILFALLAIACGSEDERPPQNEGEGGSGGAGPFAPQFAGLAMVNFDDNAGTARLSWLPATDVETPAEELTYRITAWDSNPAGGGAGRSYDWPQTIDRCQPECSYSQSVSARVVTWFAVEAIDDAMSTGLDVVVPVVGAPKVATPTIASINPATATVGLTEVELTGENFFDERTSLDGLTLGGTPIEPAFVTSWEPRKIRFRVPAGFSSGTVGVKTLLGTATTELEVLE